MKTIHVESRSDLPDNFTGIVIDQYDDKAYYQNGKYHRLDGPAVEYASGCKEWFLNDKRHRTDGPAVEWPNGYKEWYQNDKLHRTDGGPAIEWPNGYKEWYILDQELTEKQYNLFQKLWEQTDVDKTEKNMFAYVTLVTVEE